MYEKVTDAGVSINDLYIYSRIIEDFGIYGSSRQEMEDIFKKIINCDPYITYIPKQIATTLTKYLTKVNSLEVIGCEGYKELKKIAKIK